ncbi:MAG TPA: S8 family serine peptidase [Solirubrobacteraceae bacterium]
MSEGDDAGAELPAYALGRESLGSLPRVDWGPAEVTREWAFGGSTGRGVSVAVVDSGIDPDHPAVGGRVSRAVRPERDAADEIVVVDDDAGDPGGHGTACAGIIRSLAPDCDLVSVRVLGPEVAGTGADLLAGLAWAIDNGCRVINLSLSTTRRRFLEELYELADRAYFRGALIVAAAHNMPVESWPWRMAAVVSVAGHPGADPWEVHYNTGSPPVELFARGVDVDVAWTEGSTITASGNSFAAPHVAGLCALILAKRPQLAPFAVKHVLALTAANAAAPR